MGLTLGKAKSSSNRPQAPEGNHPAICVQVLDLGTHKGEYNGKPKVNRKVRISWELPEEKAVFHEDRGEEPFMVSRTYNFSVSDKSTFRKDLESWRGRAFTEEELETFDIEKLLGVGAMVNVAINDKGYSDVSTVAALPKQLKAIMPKPHNKPVYYSIEDGKTPVFDSLPDFLKEMCETCEEWKAAGSSTSDEPPFDADASTDTEDF
jgi:hypothetical protein